MLVKFSTRHGQLVMLGESAVMLLKLGGHSGTVPSAVLVADLPGFLDRLRRGLELRGDELSPAPPPAEPARRDDDEPRERPVSLRQRAVPLLDMIQTAIARRIRPDVGSGLTVRTAMLLLVPALALLLLAAHFFHAGLDPVAAVAILLVALLFAPRAWAARTVQVVLALGAVEWVVTAYTLAGMRARHDQPYVRLLVILGAVAVFTASRPRCSSIPCCEPGSGSAAASRFQVSRRQTDAEPRRAVGPDRQRCGNLGGLRALGTKPIQGQPDP